MGGSCMTYFLRGALLALTALCPAVAVAQTKLSAPKASYAAAGAAAIGQPSLRWNVQSDSSLSSTVPHAWGADEAVVRAFIGEAWNKGDFRNLSTQLAPVVTLHFGGRDIPLQVEDMIAFVQRFRNAFADFRWTVDEAVSQGGTVAMRTTFSGTMTGPFDGHLPNGKSMKVSFQLFGHIRDGRIYELWEEYDVAGMRRQLGIGT
jgi:steroid delta-isomerase-like uncharacterized protein